MLQFRHHACSAVPAVPCHQRAAAVTGAGNAAERLLEGDAGEEWVAADGPETGRAASNARDAADDEDIPTLGEEGGAKKVGSVWRNPVSS